MKRYWQRQQTKTFLVQHAERLTDAVIGHEQTYVNATQKSGDICGASRTGFTGTFVVDDGYTPLCYA